jgi:HSP20 family protein
MNLIKFNSRTPNKSFFNGFADDFFNTNISNFIGSDFVMGNPSVNVIETDKYFKIEVAAPGLAKNDFNLSVEKDQLIIGSLKKEEKEVKEKKFTRREFNYTSFKRNFHLPETVDANKITAKYENGILNITLPKVDKADIEASHIIKIS